LLTGSEGKIGRRRTSLTLKVNEIIYRRRTGFRGIVPGNKGDQRRKSESGGKYRHLPFVLVICFMYPVTGPGHAGNGACNGAHLWIFLLLKEAMNKIHLCIRQLHSKAAHQDRLEEGKYKLKFRHATNVEDREITSLGAAIGRFSLFSTDNSTSKAAIMKYLFLLLFLTGIVAFAARQKVVPRGQDSDLTMHLQGSSWNSLFNGKDLSGWNSYLGPEVDSNGKRVSDQPLGLNNDPRKVFTVVSEDGEKAIRISGDGFGAISTKKEFDNYHLQLQFKWGRLQWGQKKNKKKDSGLLYHSVGPYGADNGAWMRSQEFQVEEGNCGDYWGCAGGTADIPAIKKSDSQYVYTAGAPLYTFSANTRTGRHCIKGSDAENPSGNWNTLDLYCHGDTSVHVVNGRVMMILYHSAQSDKGEVHPLIKGSIQLQSEGAEVFYRQIKIQPFTKLPALN
jgi:hypothetical protein